MKVIGVDPGKDGAFVVVESDGKPLEIVRIRDLLGKEDWAAKADVLACAMRALVQSHDVRLAVLERDAGRPGEGAGSARTTGRGWGMVRGILAAYNVETRTPTAKAWTAVMYRDMAGDDPKAKGIALATLAGVPLTRGKETKPQTGVSDAYCLALYGLKESR